MRQSALITNACIVNRGRIDVTATDHAPHTLEEQACHAPARATRDNGMERDRHGQTLEGPSGIAPEFER